MTDDNKTGAIFNKKNIVQYIGLTVAVRFRRGLEKSRGKETSKKMRNGNLGYYIITGCLTYKCGN